MKQQNVYESREKGLHCYKTFPFTSICRFTLKEAIEKCLVQDPCLCRGTWRNVKYFVQIKASSKARKNEIQSVRLLFFMNRYGSLGLIYKMCTQLLRKRFLIHTGFECQCFKRKRILLPLFSFSCLHREITFQFLKCCYLYSQKDLLLTVSSVTVNSSYHVKLQFFFLIDHSLQYYRFLYCLLQLNSKTVVLSSCSQFLFLPFTGIIAYQQCYD